MGILNKVNRTENATFLFPGVNFFHDLELDVDLNLDF